MGIKKNPGPKLRTKIRGSVDDFPKEFLALVGLDTVTQENPPDIDPSPIVGLLVESRCVQERTDEWKKTDTSLTDDPSKFPLVSRIKLPDGQVGLRTRTLVKDGTSLPTLTALFQDADQHNLGNGFLDQTIITKPTVFPQLESEVAIDVATPPEFRALLKTFTEGLTLAGSALDPPVLGAGELSRKEQNQDLFTFRRTRVYRDLATLPQQITGSRTNRFKEVESITKILELDTATPAVPTGLLDVTFTKLGDGTAVEERILRPGPPIFNEIKYSVSIPSLIPAEMRAAALMVTTEQTLLGNAVQPTLGGGDYAASDQQLDLFTHRTSVTHLSTPTLPIILVSQEVTSEFGGGLLFNIKTLDTIGGAASTLDYGLATVSCVIKRLGTSFDLKETRQLSAGPGGTWPILESQVWDDEMQIYRLEQEQVVADHTAPVSGTYFNESVKAIDNWKSKRTRIYRTPTALGPGSAIVTYDYKPFQFPGTFDYSIWLGYAHDMGFRQTTAMLCKQKIKTWWLVKNPGPPTIGAVGSGADVEIDEIFTDTVTLPIFTSGSVTESRKFPGVLHDHISTAQGLVFPATSPNFTQYRYGSLSGGTTTVRYAILTGPGTGYAVNDLVTVPGGFGSTHVGAVGVSNSILSFNPDTSGTAPDSNSIQSTSYSASGAITGGSGTGATGQTLTVVYNNYTPGSAWIGSERVIAVKISKTEIPFLWKIQTKSVVMR